MIYLTFRVFIIFVFIILMLSCLIVHRKQQTLRPICDEAIYSGIYLKAVTAYWAMTMIFFLPALVYDFCLLPGDILCSIYPWKAVFSPNNLIHNNLVHNPLLSDALSNYYPWMSSLKKGITNGYLPLWNFNSYSGSPLVANFASALFNPLNIFLYIMGVPDFTTLMPFLRVVITATGTFVFLKSLKFSNFPSFMGGALFAFSGFEIVWLSNYPNITVIMYLPWLMLCVQKIASGDSIVWVFILIILSVFQFLGGHPESSFHIYLIIIPYFFYELYLQRKVSSYYLLYKRFLMVVVAGILSLGCVAFQLFPFLEYLPYTTRYFEIIEQGNNIFGSFDFIALLKLVVGTIINPDFFGNPVDGNYWTFANYNEQNTFFSVTGLFLCGISIVTPLYHLYGKLFFIISAVLSFLTIVRLPYFYDLVNKLPLFSMATNYRLIFVFVFCMTILATAGVQTISENKTHYKNFQLKLKFQIISVSFILSVIALTLHFSTLHDIKPQFLNYRFEKLIFFFIILGLITTICIGALYSKKTGALFPLIAVLIIFTEYAYHSINYNTFIDKNNIYPKSPLINYITSQSGKYRVVGWKGALIAGAEQVHGYDSITGYDPMKIYAYEKILTKINGAYSPIFTCEIKSLDSEWINFLNVKYIVTPPDNNDKIFYSNSNSNSDSDSDSNSDSDYNFNSDSDSNSNSNSNYRFKLVYKGNDGKVYENKECYPRAFRVKINGVKENSFENSELKNSQPEIIKYEKNEIILKTPANKTPASKTPASKTPANKNQNAFSTSPNKSDTSPSDSLIIVSEVWFPGWKVFIDGTPKEIIKVNSTFMGVMVKEEDKEIKFIFKPESFSNGVILSILCFVLSIVIFLYYQLLFLRKKNSLPLQSGV